MGLLSLEVLCLGQWGYYHWRFSVWGNGVTITGGSLFGAMGLLSLEVLCLGQWGYYHWRFSVWGNGVTITGGSLFGAMGLLSLVGAATSIIFVATKVRLFCSDKNYVCRDKSTLVL